MEKWPLSEKYMLSINEAGAYFNIGVKKMRDWQKIIWEHLLCTVEIDT